MGLFDRMGKVISSNLNSMLDKAEDDKKLLELNLEEMSEQLKAGRQDVIAAVAAEKQLRKKADDIKADIERWEKRAELAMKSEDEALAREALKQKKRCEGEIDSVEKARLEQRDTALKMKEELERMEQKLEELKLRKGTIAARAAGPFRRRRREPRRPRWLERVRQFPSHGREDRGPRAGRPRDGGGRGRTRHDRPSRSRG